MKTKTWIASTYYTEYGTKIGVCDTDTEDPPHQVLAAYLVRFQGGFQPGPNAGINKENKKYIPNYIVITDFNAGGVTLQEMRCKDDSLFAEHRIYLTKGE